MNGKHEADSDLKVPKLLQVVLGKDRVVSLRGLLTSVAKERVEAQRLVTTLARESDHPEYKKLLDQTWCYVEANVSVLKQGFTLDQYSSQADVLGRAVETLLNSTFGRKNVICYGYGKKSASRRGSSVQGAPFSERYFTNGTAKTLAAPAWELLLSRIGDTLMLYILLHVSMFWPLENGCYFQLTGQPVTNHARAVKKTSDAIQSKLMMKLNDEKIHHMSLRMQPARIKCHGKATENTLNKAQKNSSGQGTEQKQGVFSGIKRKSRPSSWQRKKFKKMMTENDASARKNVTQGSSREFITQSLPSEPTTTALKDTESDKIKTYYQYPKYLSRPSEMLIPRLSMFYSSRYGKKCGLSSKHILMRLNNTKKSSKILYQFIFRRYLNPVALRKNQYDAKHLAPFPKCRFVPARFRYILPWLQRLINNAKKCPYGILLNIHCPLRHKSIEMSVPSVDHNREPVDETLLDVERNGRVHQRVPDWNQRFESGVSKQGLQAQAKHGQNEDWSHQSNENRNSSNMRLLPATMDTNEAAKIPNLTDQFVPHANVSNFVWSVLKRIVPKQMLGGKNVQRALRSALRRFVNLKRYETMTVHQLMNKFPLSDLKWLDVRYSLRGIPKNTASGPNEAERKAKMARLWIGWIFSVIVVPTLRAHFYCTENESYRQQVFYYRKKVWANIVEKAFHNTLSSTFVPAKTKVVKARLANRKIGVSRIRMLPKRTGIRFLVNMKKKSEATFPSKRVKRSVGGKKIVDPRTHLSFPSINLTLKHAHTVLKYEAMKQPDAFGSSTYSSNDIFCRYTPFVKRWRSDRIKEAAASQNFEETMNQYGPHMVCVDVSRAFDNVDVATLMGIISSLLVSEEYTIVKYTEIVTIMGKIRVLHRNAAVPSHELEDGHFSQKMASISNGHKNRIFLDAVTEERIKRATIMKSLEEYLSFNIVRMKKKWRCQEKGIAQGGRPSTLLCSLYLGYVERACLEPMITSCGSLSQMISHSIPLWSGGDCDEGRTPLTAMGMAAKHEDFHMYSSNPSGCLGCPRRSHTLLLRMVDDWILISRHKNVAEQFAKRVLQGIPGFNIIVNPAKTQLSFTLYSLPEIGILRPSIYEEADGRKFMKWCGFLVDVDSLEIRADYTRYSGEHMATTLNIPTGRNLGSTLSSKLCHYIRPKLTPLLLDHEVNTPLTIRINVYQIFLLAAMKLHCFVSGMETPPTAGKPFNWILSAIDIGIRYVIEGTRAKMVSKHISSSFCDPRLPYSHVEFLGLHAFHTVLSKKQSRYQNLLQSLSERMSQPNCKICAPHLADAISPLHSAIFDSIIY